MSVQIAVRLPEDALRRLDAAIERGAFPSRAAAARLGIDRLLREEREREIEEAYRRAYAGGESRDGEQRVGEAGLALGADLITAEDARTE